MKNGGVAARGDIGVLRSIPLSKQSLTRRYTIIISRKTAKTAVLRNRIKRRVRAYLDRAPLPSGSTYVFYPTILVEKISWPALKESFSKLIKDIRR